METNEKQIKIDNINKEINILKKQIQQKETELHKYITDIYQNTDEDVIMDFHKQIDELIETLNQMEKMYEAELSLYNYGRIYKK